MIRSKNETEPVLKISRISYLGGESQRTSQEEKMLSNLDLDSTLLHQVFVEACGSLQLRMLTGAGAI